MIEEARSVIKVPILISCDVIKKTFKGPKKKLSPKRTHMS